MKLKFVRNNLGKFTSPYMTRKSNGQFTRKYWAVRNVRSGQFARATKSRRVIVS